MNNQLKILIALDSFKGSLNASNISNIIASELLKSNLAIEIAKIPLADGGEGSLAAIENVCGFQAIECQVHNPSFEQVNAMYLFDNKSNSAYIELASASGIHWITPDYRITKGSTFGTGELMRHAIEKGAQKIVLFAGGSATNDAGLGIMEALGFRFFDSNGQKITPLPRNMLNINAFDEDYSILQGKNIEIVVAVDVDNPFYGKQGAACVYAPQKGAKPEQVMLLDEGLHHMAKLIQNYYTVDIQQIKGSGAAGGVGGGLYAFGGAKIVSGSNLIFDLLNLEEKIKAADLIISGEGKVDAQTLNNKLLFNISKLASKHKKKLWVVCGFVEDEQKMKNILNFEKIFCLARDKNDIPESILHAEERLKSAGALINSSLNLVN